jgi:hypothetical protein
MVADILKAAMGLCAPFVVVFGIASLVCIAERIGEGSKGKRKR